MMKIVVDWCKKGEKSSGLVPKLHRQDEKKFQEDIDSFSTCSFHFEGD